MNRSVRWSLSACLVVAGTAAFAEGEKLQKPSFEEKRDAKLAEPWVTAAPWITDYDKAREEAKASGKPIFAYFTCSYFH